MAGREGSLEVFVMVQGIARDDEEQAGTRGGFGPPLGFTTLRQRISGQRWAPPSVIPEMRTLSSAKRRDCIINPVVAVARPAG
jgi:hypothetical protein